MVTNEDIMAELKKIRQEQAGFTNLIVSLVMVHATEGDMSVHEVMDRTNRMIDEKRVP